MRVAILYPPDFNRPMMVFGALPLFNACLKRAGHETMLCDVGAEAFSLALEPGVIERYFAAYDNICAELEAKPDRTPGETGQLIGLRNLSNYPRDLMLECRDAAAGMRDPERFYQPTKYRHFDRVIRTTHTFLNSFTPQLDTRHKDYTRDLYAYMEGETVDAYLEYYENVLIPKLEEFGPDLIAMSCPFSPQVAAGMYLAKLVKRRLPNVKFLMGGTGVSDTAELILSQERFYSYVDFCITGDGEEALPAMCDAIDGKLELDQVPGLWRLENGEVKRPANKDLADLNASPTPDYTDVDFTHYMLPEKAGIYTTSRGCYYGKCTFCPESFRDGFRRRDPDRVYEDVKNIAEVQGIRHLHFFDPLTPPATLRKVSQRIAEDKLDIHWYAEVKFDNIYTKAHHAKTLAEGGCKQLQFGLESSVQRVLDKMLKGNKIDRIKTIVQNLYDHGITAVATWFIGFPSETREDALETWRFWHEQTERLQLNLYTGTFSVGPEIPVYNDPAAYDSKIVVNEDGFPHCVPASGKDWDKEELHKTLFVRSDIQVTICGAGLLYAAYHPERLYELRNINMVGPTSFDSPPLEERTVWVASENSFRVLDQQLDGAEGIEGFVAESLQTKRLTTGEAALIERVQKAGKVHTSELIKTDEDRINLAKMIDLGFLESRDPVTARLQFLNRMQPV